MLIFGEEDALCLGRVQFDSPEVCPVFYFGYACFEFFGCKLWGFGAVPVAEIIGELGDFGYGNWRVIDVGNVEEEEEGT